MTHTAQPIAALHYQHRFVAELPGDPSTATGSRAVLEACYSRVTPTPVAAPDLLALTPEVARQLGLDPSPTPDLAPVLAGNRVLPGMQPYAACYGGHQFGHWAGQLGDGRAITLAEVLNGEGESWELQLKGAGRTPYSRGADGRAVLRSSLREYVCSEAMHHLGVPTTRALSLCLTGEPVMRDLLYDGHPAYEPGAVVARVAPSFLRFGNYEIHAARKDYATLSRLVRFTLERHYPQFVQGQGGALDIAGFFEEVCRRTAALLVEWTRVGFVHGVMNTDNMSILGLTIDYGPFGFLESFDPDWTPNITDAMGRRYRFEQQARVAHWNLAQLAGALAPLLGDVSSLEQSLSNYAEQHQALEQAMWLKKLGLNMALPESDALLTELFGTLTATEIDMPLFFRHLAELDGSHLEAARSVRLQVLSDAFYDLPNAASQALERVDAWLVRYLELVRADNTPKSERRARMHSVNPLYLPRNYLLHQVIEKTEAGDRSALPELLEVLHRPYEEQHGREAFAAKRPDWARHKPGCSMLSCSS
jgi:uncharacterized protein YdiU (UPF0061 family)